ncbi:RND family transporter [Faecalibacillus intestinalis]|uniref:efflux RND transporter permease subunit n=1 Tax=Faecalibacillus intestinalis TaxID=1982626 RepID=UPI0035219F3F
MKKLGEIIGKFVVKHKILIVIASVILCIPSLFGYINTDINYDILVYLPEDIDTMKGQDILAKDFDMGSFAMCVVENMSSKDVLDLEEKYKEIDGVVKVVSANDMIGTTIPQEMLPSDVTKQYKKGNSELMLVTFKDSTIAIDAITQMREITSEEVVKIGGMSASTLDTSIVADSEIITYVIVAVILVLIVLMASLDSYVVPFLLLGNIGLAILYNMGSNIFLGQISYITKAIAAVLQLGVTTDFSIFLYHKYEQAKTRVKTNNETMTLAIGDTLVSIAGSSLTTIAGFLALCTMQLTLGSDIGIVMAKGVFIGVLSTVTIFPAFLLVFDKLVFKTKHKPIIPSFNVIKHYKIILLVALVIAYPAYYGNAHVKSYYNLTKDLPQDLKSCVANSELSDEFDLVASQVILVDKGIKDNDLNKMVDEIENVESVNLVLSPSQLSDLAIPDEMIPDDVKDIFESDRYKMIFVNSTEEIATNKLNKVIDKIDHIIKKYDKNAIMAGEGPCMKDLVNIADEDFRNVSIASIGIIFIIMLFVLKSISLPVLLVSGIELAIFINMAISYYTGDVLPFVASIVIGTIQLGATIDYAILLTTKYLENRKNGIDKIKAMDNAISNSAGSIFVSGMSFFAATFGVGMISKLNMIASLCNLMSRGALISMFIVICVIPAILLVFDKVIIHTSIGFKQLKNKGEC